MTTYNATSGSGLPAYGLNRVTVLEATIDLSTAGGTVGLVQNDVVQVVNIPANCLVLGVNALVEDAGVSANLADFDIGDGDDTDGFLDGKDATVALSTWSGGSGSVTAYAAGKFYPVADTIDLIVMSANTITTGTIKISVPVLDFTRSTN